MDDPPGWATRRFSVNAEFIFKVTFRFFQSEKMPRKTPTQHRWWQEVDRLGLYPSGSRRPEDSDINAALIVANGGLGEMKMLDVCPQMKHGKPKKNAKSAFLVDKDKNAIFGVFVSIFSMPNNALYASVNDIK